MAGFVLLCLPETRGVSLENMEALFEVWMKDTPLSEKMRLQGGRAQARAARKHAAGTGRQDVEAGVTERKQ
jgi:hypothetical protein